MHALLCHVLYLFIIYLLIQAGTRLAEGPL